MIVMTEDNTSVAIPTWLMKKIEERLPRTEFKSPSEYVTYVMTQIVSDQEKKYSLTEEEEGKIKDRLKALGYL